MDKRLEKIAQMIQNGRGVADVGTDHGFLPVRLARNGYTGRLFASDINPGPLSAARRSAEAAGAEDRIEFLLCDGLEDCPRDEIDTIVIAGMGGDAICGILDRAEWCMDGGYTLLLQPMTKAEVLRYWLVNNGFRLTREAIVPDGRAFYQIIEARCAGNMPLSDAELFVGAFENIKSDPAAPELISRSIGRMRKEIAGLLEASEPNTGRLTVCRSVLDGLIKMKGELKCVP